MQGYLWCLHFEEKIEGLWTGKVKSDFCIEFLRVLKYYSIFQWNLNFLKPWIFLKLYLLPKHSCHLRLGAGDFTQRNPATVIGGADLGFLLGWGAPLRNGITDWWHNSNWHVQFSSETEGSMRRSQAKSTGYPWTGHVAMMYAEHLLWPTEGVLCQTTNLWRHVLLQHQ